MRRSSIDAPLAPRKIGSRSALPASQPKAFNATTSAPSRPVTLSLSPPKGFVKHLRRTLALNRP